MARVAWLSTADDMEWLRDVHLPTLGVKWRSAEITGNEDSPDRIEVWESEDPLRDDPSRVFVADEDGELHEVKLVKNRRRRRR